jgi:hypothetical protein
MDMTLFEKRNNLLAEKMKMDKFFTMFLDKFERKMDPENSNTPIWKLYKEKHKEYGRICQEIRNTDYYIKRQAYV